MRTDKEPVPLNVRRLTLFTLLSTLAALAGAVSTAHADSAGAPGGANGSSVESYYGAYKTSDPIVVPAFHQIEPRLGLGYSSTSTNGQVGTGWALAGISTIERANPGRGAPRYDGADIFLLDGQELVPCTTQGGTHCTKIQNYQRITRDAANDRWLVRDKKGTELTFIPLYQAGSGIFRWALSTVVDVVGNTVNYGYWCDPGADCYPDNVSYNGTVVKFYWETRPDSISFATGSSLGRTNFRLKTVDVTTSGTRARSYKLAYATSTNSGRSLLSSVQQFGADASLDGTGTVVGGTALPAASYGYDTASFTTAAGALAWPTAGYVSMDRDGTGDARSGGVEYADFNGDGITDIARSQWECNGWYNAGCEAHNEILLGTGNGYVAGPAWPTGGYLAMDRDSSGDMRDGGVRLVDMNGDGKTDIVWSLWECSGWYGAGCAAHNEIWLSTGSGFVAGPAWPTAGYLAMDRDGTGDTRDGGVRLVDMNGDGITDVVRSQWECSGWYNPGCEAHNEILLGTGSGFVAGPAWPVAGYLAMDRDGTGDMRDGGVRLVDMNGDGKLDVVWSLYECSGWYNPGCEAHNQIMLNVGYGFVAGPAWPTAGYLAMDRDGTGDVVDGGVRLVDMNGDGKTDVVWSLWEGSGWYGAGWQAHNEIRLNTGSGFVAGPAWPIAGYLAMDRDGSGDVRDGGVRLVDMNGDGITDVVWSMWECNGWYNAGCEAHNQILLGTGNNFVAGPAWPIGGYLAIDRDSSGDMRDGGVRLVDMNGDGRMDVVWSQWECSSWYGAGCQAHNQIVLSSGGLDLLKTESNGLGGTTNVTYKPSSAWPGASTPFGMLLQTVSGMTTSDGRGASSTTNYSYSGGLWSNSERRFLGFRKVTAVLDAAGNYTETYYHQHVGCIAKPEITYYRNAQGNIYRYSSYGYTENTTAPYTSLMTDRWEYECNLSNSCRRTLLQIGYDQYGNGNLTYEWGDYDVAGDERTALRGLVPNTGSYIVGMPAYENLYAGIGTSGTLLKQTLFEYDGSGTYTAAPTRGLVSRKKGWDSQTGGYATSSYVYDAWGNITSETDPRGAVSNTEYDTVRRTHQVRKCNALGHCSTKNWVPGLDLVQSETDINGNVTSYTHDALGRLLQTFLPDGTTETLQYLDWGNAYWQRIRRTISDGTSDGLWMEIYEDGIGRQYKAVKEGGLTQETLYNDGSKRAWKKSNWYAAGETPQFQVFAFDGLGRMRTVTNPDGTVGQTVYGNDYVITYDELNHEKVTWNDAYGQTRAVREKNGASYQTTNYTNDLMGNLTRVSDAAGNVTSVYWSSLGRKVAGCDPDTGCSSYTYDGAGLALTHRDAKGQLTSINYDALGRPLVRTAGDGTQISWAYDQAGHGASKGAWTSVTDSSGTTSRNYDTAGRVTASTKCIAGTCATTGSSYDAAGRLTTTIYPDGEVVNYGYDAAGRLASVSGYVTSIQYNARGQMVSIDYANGTRSSYAYSAQRDWLQAANVTGPAGVLLEMSYGYDAAARVTSTSSSTNPLATATYGYDDLGRLTSVSGGQNQAFVYDALGNILQNSAVGAYGYADGAHRHAATTAGSNSYAYDANGNMTAGGGRNLAWNADNQLSAVTTNGVTVTNDYDFAGDRVRRVSSSGTKLFFSRIVELAQGAWTKHYYAGNVLVASNTAGVKTFYHADHLGSTRLLTNAAGQKIQAYDYASFGATARSEGTSANAKLYGGHERDVDAGLVYMRARYYDANLGRFLSADSMVPDALNPQALNRYAYVYNNPISNADPTGHVPVVAAIITSAAVGATVGVATTAFAISVIGAATMTIGYVTHDPVLMSIGGVLLGASSGCAFGAGFLGQAGTMQATMVGGGMSLMTSPISPLDPKLKQAIGWAYAAQSIIHDFMNLDDTVDKYSKEYATEHPISADKAAELRGAANSMTDAQKQLASDSSQWSFTQKLYGKAVENMTGGALTQGQAIALNTSGGLIGPGAGFQMAMLETFTGWMPGMRIHAALHDAGGFIGYYPWAGNWLNLNGTSMLAGHIEGALKGGGASGAALYSRGYGW